MKKRELIKRLKPFWEEHSKLIAEFYKKEAKLEEKMNKKLKLKIKLEFFYCDGECCGIGAEDFSQRKNFPLIQDSQLDEK